MTNERGKFWRRGAACLLAAAALTALAFDWPSKPSEQLYADMLKYVTENKACLEGTPLLAEADKFLEETQRKHGKDPGAWMDDLFALSWKILDKNPPRVENGKVPKIREFGLRLIDYPVHVRYSEGTNGPDEGGEPLPVRNGYNLAAYHYYSGALDRVLKDVGTVKVGPGEAKLWKIYSSGIVIKTAHKVIGIDIACGYYGTYHGSNAKLLAEVNKRANAKYSGKKGKKKNTVAHYAVKDGVFLQVFTPAAVDALCNQLDILFVSHEHGDHWDSAVVRGMLERGKPVVMPNNFAANMKNAKPGAAKVVYGDMTEPKVVDGVKFWAIPGKQRVTLNNIYLIEADGIRVAQHGDNDQYAKEKDLAKLPPANIILAACWNWMPNMVHCCRSAPGAAEANQIVVPYHENELGHRVQQRESYWELFTKGDRLPGVKGIPVYPIGCGERLDYPEKAAPAADAGKEK